MTMHKINKLPGYIVWHREYSQYFMITLNVIYSIKILNPYVACLKLILHCKSAIFHFLKIAKYQFLRAGEGCICENGLRLLSLFTPCAVAGLKVGNSCHICKHIVNSRTWLNLVISIPVFLLY